MTTSESARAAHTSAALLAEFTARRAAVRDRVTFVLDRWTAPSPYRSYAEYSRELAAAYDAQAELWRAVIDYVTRHSDLPELGHPLVFDALLDAYNGTRQEAHTARREARESARWEQERAYATYADNISAAQLADTPLPRTSRVTLREVA